MPSLVLRTRVLSSALLGSALLVGCMPSTPASSPRPTMTPSSEPTASGSPSAEPSPSEVVTAWRQLAPAAGGPIPREDHTWTVDGEGEVAYLFGGRDATGPGTLDDFWAFDLEDETWSELPAGPAGRFGHNASWVPGVGVVIFAGQGDAGFFNDLWAYDPVVNGWRELPAAGAIPVRRYGSCAALGPDGRLWISHGFTSEGARFSDTRAYDFATGTWTEETPANEGPVVRCLHGCWWTDDGQLALYAGQTNGVVSLGDWWNLTIGPRPGTNQWAEVPVGEAGPAPRNLYASTRWGSSAVVFGGQALDRSSLGDAWQLSDDGIPSVITSTGGVAPAGRSGSELVADTARHRVLLFGGIAGGTVLGDVWELTLP